MSIKRLEGKRNFNSGAFPKEQSFTVLDSEPVRVVGGNLLHLAYKRGDGTTGHTAIHEGNFDATEVEKALKERAKDFLTIEKINIGA